MAASKTQKVTVLFADVSESTRLYNDLGDAKAKEILEGFMEMMSIVILKHRGRIIKTIGDEVMCIFDNADLAAAAAIGMQEKVILANCKQQHQVTLRIGFHHGRVIREAQDVFGDTVNIAARMVSQAKGNQVLTTEDTIKSMISTSPDDIRYVDKTRVKGKSEMMRLYEIVWGAPEEMTMLGTTASSDHINDLVYTAQITLSYKNQQISMDERSPGLTIGRLASCDLSVSDKRVSRLHARIEFRRNKFVLIDQSTNGTYVTKLDSNPVIIRRDEIVLSGEGLLGLGRPPENSPVEPIRFTCQEK